MAGMGQLLTVKYSAVVEKELRQYDFGKMKSEHALVRKSVISLLL